MTAIERIKAHFDSIGTRKLVVPEWGGLEIYYTPYTVAERNRIYGEAKDEEPVIQIIISKARDAEGKPLFTVADKAALLQRADAHVLTRIAAEMISSATPAELGNS